MHGSWIFHLLLYRTDSICMVSWKFRRPPYERPHASPWPIRLVTNVVAERNAVPALCLKETSKPQNDQQLADISYSSYNPDSIYFVDVAVVEVALLLNHPYLKTKRKMTMYVEYYPDSLVASLHYRHH